METRKAIGIISSILLILNYIGNVIVDLLFNDNIQIIEFYDTIGRLIFTLSMIGFYYSLTKYLKPYEFKTEIKILVSLIVIEFASLILNGIHYYFGVIPGFILSIVYISAVILFIIFGIRTLKSKNELFVNLRNLKIFITSMFIAFGLIIFSAALLAFNHRMEFLNIAFSIYGIPYVFGLIFFLKGKEEEKLAIIQSEFERLYDPNHPVRNNIETLDSIEDVRIIKDALK